MYVHHGVNDSSHLSLSPIHRTISMFQIKEFV